MHIVNKQHETSKLSKIWSCDKKDLSVEINYY